MRSRGLAKNEFVCVVGVIALAWAVGCRALPGEGAGAGAGAGSPGSGGAGGGAGAGGAGGSGGAGGTGGTGGSGAGFNCASNCAASDPASTTQPTAGNKCTACCADCACTSINYSCDLSCYTQTTSDCGISATANGGAPTATGAGVGSGCGMLACVAENDITKQLHCTASACPPPVVDAGVATPQDAGPPAPPAAFCANANVNDEPEIFAGTQPVNGGTVSESGQIKVWTQDENPINLSPGEMIDPATGKVTAPGDRTALDPQGFPWGPKLYIGPSYLEDGGTPYYADYILGDYDNNPPNGNGANVPGMDPPPAGIAITESYVMEAKWNVSSLHLPPGTYALELFYNDGDDNHGVLCMNVTITP